MARALSLAALLALAACSGPSTQRAATPAPTGITASRGGGAQALGNQGVGNPFATTRTAPVR